MDNIKRAKLEKRGWKVGSADEFLNLSTEESAYLALKLNLSHNLRDLRKKYNFTQIKLLNWRAIFMIFKRRKQS